MDIGKTIDVSSRNGWRKWLDKNHDKEQEIWIVFYKKTTGKQTLFLMEAMDEAICFGWIDSIEKGIDKERFALRFTPRRTKSNWSKPNIERARRLIAEGKMTKAGFDKLPDEAKLV